MDDRVAAGLADTIQALRNELALAVISGRDEKLQFEVAQVELEMSLAITRGGSGDAGLHFGVLSFGAGGKVANEATHRLILTLSPLMANADGETQPARISGHVHGEPR